MTEVLAKIPIRKQEQAWKAVVSCEGVIRILCAAIISARNSLPCGLTALTRGRTKWMFQSASRCQPGIPGIPRDARGHLGMPRDAPKPPKECLTWMFLMEFTHQQFCEVVGVVGVADQLSAGDRAGVGQLGSYEHCCCCHQLLEGFV